MILQTIKYNLIHNQKFFPTKPKFSPTLKLPAVVIHSLVSCKTNYDQQNLSKEGFGNELQEGSLTLFC